MESSELDLSKMEASEEEKIQAMMMQSTADYDPKRLVVERLPLVRGTSKVLFVEHITIK